jgi:two-component system, NarL family, sensor histidine kinase DevS
MADRERIAFDLHDLVIQRLFAAGLALKSTANITVDQQIARRLNRVIDELDGTIVDIRTTIFALGHRYKSPSSDLCGQILDLVRDARTLGHDPEIRFYGPIATAVPDVVAEHLLAVLREVLSNVARHAHATKTTIYLNVSGNLVLQVTDNGVGTAGSSPSSGLRNMASRAESLGGGTELTSPSGGGTCVKWWVPVGRSEQAGGA